MFISGTHPLTVTISNIESSMEFHLGIGMRRKSDVRDSRCGITAAGDLLGSADATFLEGLQKMEVNRLNIR